MFDWYNVDSLFRDFKINCITNNGLFIKENRFKIFKTTEIYQVLESGLKDEIITGSISLWLFGLLPENRKFKDIDVITSKDIKDIKSLKAKSTYGGEMVDGFIGYKEYNFKSGFFFKKDETIEIDYFKNNSQNYTEYNGFKFHNPFEIIQFKIDLIKNDHNSNKHRMDLDNIFNSI
jgi:hypothetical protein